MEKLNLFKIKCFPCVKDPVVRMTSQHADEDKIFANHIFDKGLISRIYKKFSKFNNKKIDNVKIQNSDNVKC